MRNRNTPVKQRLKAVNLNYKIIYLPFSNMTFSHEWFELVDFLFNTSKQNWSGRRNNLSNNMVGLDSQRKHKNIRHIYNIYINNKYVINNIYIYHKTRKYLMKINERTTRQSVGPKVRRGHLTF